MSNLKVQASLTGTGVVTLVPPTTNTDRTVTLPDQTGTVYITGGDIGTPSAGNGSNLTNLNASNLGSGTVPDARFPATLPAASGANLTALNASNLGSGTVPDARFPATLPAASGANLTALNASNLDSGTIPNARFPATLPAASGANLTNLNASNLSSGTVATARLGSGTANNTTFLRGDNTWATVSGGITLSDAANLGVGGSVTISYLTSTASVSIGGDISGVYLFRATSGSTTTFQNTNAANTPGLDLRNRTTSFTFDGTHTPIGFGTWRLLGPIHHNGTLWQDIGYGNMATTRLTRGSLFIRVA
jgi:hypothetical protein